MTIHMHNQLEKVKDDGKYKKTDATSQNDFSIKPRELNVICCLKNP